MEESRDLLIEMNSFDPDIGHGLIRGIRESEASGHLKTYMESCFECFGVDVEDLHEMATFIKPNDNMFIPHFPHLEAEGQTITFDRREALEREDYQFINWDHPMVREISNLVLSESYGNMTVATRRDGGGKKSFVEAFFVTDCPAPDFLDLKRFFPPTLIRVLIDKDGVDFDEKFSKDLLDTKLIQGDRTLIERASKLPKDLIKGLLKKAEVIAKEKSELIVEKQRLNLVSSMDNEVSRLEALSQVNPNISQDEVELMRAMKKVMLDHTQGVRLRLEAVRVIL
jgi:ATP-dependent helicase HepA